MKAIRFISCVAGLCSLATSCASFPNHRVPEAPKTPVSKVNRVSISYEQTSGSELMQGHRQESPAVAKLQYDKEFESALNGSGRFSSVSKGKGGSVHVDVDMLNYGNGGAAMVSGFICGFSLFTVPGFGTDNYKLVATARSSAGKSRQYVLDDGVTTVFWLPLIFVAPFKSPMTVVPEVHENMYRNLIQHMERDGVIPKVSN